jgi:hypothetical protein
MVLEEKRSHYEKVVRIVKATHDALEAIVATHG